MPRYITSLYLALFNTAALGALGMAWAFGLVQNIFVEDASRLTWVSAALLVGVIVYATWQTYRFDRMDQHDEHAIEAAMAFPNFLKAKVFLYLGLCGTLVGLSIFVSHMAADSSVANADGITATLNAMKASMKTAFNATLVGIVAKLWVEIMVFIQGWSVRRLARLDSVLMTQDVGGAWSATPVRKAGDLTDRELQSIVALGSDRGTF
jgi:hypothetical protein